MRAPFTHDFPTLKMLQLPSILSSMALLALLAPNPVTSFVPDNQSPVVSLPSNLSFPCQGHSTTVPLDASSVFDPEGDPMTFQWISGCPGQSIADDQAQVTTLTIDTSSACSVDCSIRLRVSDGVNFAYARMYIHVSGPIPAELDMLPGYCPNSVHIQGCGLVTAALVGQLSFDVTLVDRNTLRLARADGQGLSVAPCHFLACDVAVPFPDNGCNCTSQTHDGIRDLGMIFNKHDVVLKLLLHQEPDKSFLPVVLTGKLLTGEDFIAHDCIKVLTH